ncbi:tRNA wybutosine-synthesizing protein [Phytophthora palmivora]|uniref:tRNA wybutosine-synthesizing protein n=1 Tax=Phytophthora palmivora TaxID=4796 RepID=A0A2P4Y386_9STRA|nr:tRNA wybutosine-synthesizing protein [Phytophthora palmivora]
MVSPASAGLSLLLVAVGVLLYLQTHPRIQPSDAAATTKRKTTKTQRKQQENDKPKKPKAMTVRILYGTQTGASKTMAETLEKTLFALNIAGFHFQTSVVNMKDYDQDNLEQEAIVVAILSTWTHGQPPEDAKVFCNWITDMTQDFRVSKNWLNNVQHAVFGLGNAEYDEDYGTAAKNLDNNLSDLGSPSLVALGLGDDNVDQFKQFDIWMDNLVAAMCEFSSEKTVAALKKSVSPVKGKAGKKEWLSQKEFRRQKRAKKAEAAAANGETVELNEEDMMNEQFLVDDFSDDEEQNQQKANDDSGMVDVEDIGKSMKESEAASKSREMVTPMQRKALTKEGYKIIGTHSAVKLCRWTKHQLRGRGGARILLNYELSVHGDDT